MNKKRKIQSLIESVRRRKLPRFDDDLSKKKSHIFELFDSKSDLQPIFSISSKNQMFDHHDRR